MKSPLIAKMIDDYRRKREDAAAARLLPANQLTDLLGKVWASPFAAAGSLAGAANVGIARAMGDKRAGISARDNGIQLEHGYFGDAILLATEQYPDPIVFDPKDFCDGLCQCDFPVSELLKRMTPSFALRRQQEVCAGGGPFLLSDVRKQLCEAYVARATGNSLSSGPDPAMLAR